MKNLLKLNVVGFSEIDKPAIKAYCAIHGVNENKNLGDISKINPDAIDKNVTILTLGSPCQSFSSAGKLQGSTWTCKKCGHSFDPLAMENAFNDFCPKCGHNEIDKSQSSLLAHGLDVVRHVKAPIVIFENVKNLTSKKFESTFKLLIKKIEDCGYNVYYQVLNAKDFALQNRERVYMVAIRKDIDTGTFKFPTPVSNGMSINDLLEYDQELIDSEESVIIDSKIAPYLKPHINEELPQILSSTKGIYRLHLKSGFNDGGIGIDYVPALRASNSSTLVLHKIETPTGTKAKVHKLTPLEAYRFMGFSDEDYTKACNAGCKKTQIYKQAGNSIVVDVIYHIAKELFKAIPKLSENDQISILSLFSGIGAFEKAFKRVIDDANASSIFHYPDEDEVISHCPICGKAMTDKNKDDFKTLYYHGFDEHICNDCISNTEGYTVCTGCVEDIDGCFMPTSTIVELSESHIQTGEPITLCEANLELFAQRCEVCGGLYYNENFDWCESLDKYCCLKCCETHKKD